MRKILSLVSMLVLSGMLFQACQQAPQESYETEWLGETKQEIVNNLEEQFQGFSRTMREVSYRYAELYWAGMDENWEYAEYQREHITEAMEQGFVRRPEREASAQQFTTAALPEIEEIINSGDKERFLGSFTRLSASCNTCHAMEEVSFMTIIIPETRHSVVSF
ncbi:MAG: hypothetical protein ABR597_07040 [Bacteroidales bacterium]